MKVVYTIGHSTHPIETFVQMLRSFGVETLIDIRTLPWSRKFPRFNQDELSLALQQAWIAYMYLKDLWGRRKAKKDSHNAAWKNVSFRWYADHMETQEWRDALHILEEYASASVVAYMCAEAVWWRCHRALVSDALKVRWRTVRHIMWVDKKTEHPYTSPAKVNDWKLSYQ